MQSCCSPIASACPPIASGSALQLLLAASLGPIASASTAAPRLRPLPAAAPRLRLLQLLLHAHRLRPLQLLLPIASASAAAPQLRPLRLLLPDCCSPYCVRFDCCSPIACIRLHHRYTAGFQSNVLEHSSRSSRFSK